MKNNIVYACACSSPLGILAQMVRDRLNKEGLAEIVSLPDPFGDDTEFKKKAARAELNIAVDGCHVGCAHKALKCRKIKHLAFCFTDMGCEKGKTEVSEDIADKLFVKIKSELGENCA